MYKDEHTTIEKFKELINDGELFDKTAEFCGKSE